MKVAHILNELRFSGAEILLTSAAPIFQSAGPALVICTGEREGNYADEVRAANYKLVHIPFVRSLKFLVAIALAIRANRVDLVHIHAERGAVWYSLICALMRIPSIRTIHNEFRFSGFLRRRRTLSRRFAAWLGTRHISCSPSVQRIEKTWFGLDTVVINNWFDPKRAAIKSTSSRQSARARLGVDDNRYVIVSISNESAAKNLMSLFKGVNTLQGFDSSPILFHCGEVGDTLLEYAAKSKDGCICAVGSTPEVDIYLAAADVFVSSSFNEGGPLVLLEAAAGGTPCITTRVGLAELLDGEEAVWFIAPTADAIAEAIAMVGRIPREEREAMAANLAKNVRGRFSPEIGARKYLAAYNEIIKRS